MSSSRRYRSPSDRRSRRSRSPRETRRRRDSGFDEVRRRRRSSRSRRARSLSPNHYSTAEKHRTRRRRRHRRLSFGSVNTDDAVRGSSGSRDLSDRDGGYRHRRGGRRRRGGSRDDDEEDMKTLIVKFFHHYSIIYNMVKGETEMMYKQPCMGSRNVKRHYKGNHFLRGKLDDYQTPLELLKTVSKETAKVGDKLNKTYRAKFFDHHSRDEEDSRGHRSSRKGRRDDGYDRRDNRREERSDRRDEPRGRRDRYERRSERGSRSERSSRRDRRDEY